MLFVLGVVLFALGIAVSIALHEAGHMYAAKAFGMRVRRYFIGFGPKVVLLPPRRDRVRAQGDPGGRLLRHRGDDRAGRGHARGGAARVLPQAHVAARHRALGGSLTHFVIGMVLVYALAVSAGLPNLRNTPVVGELSCAADQVSPTALADARPASPRRPSPRGCRPATGSCRWPGRPRRPGRTPSRPSARRPGPPGRGRARRAGDRADRRRRAGEAARPERRHRHRRRDRRRAADRVRVRPGLGACPRRWTSPARCSATSGRASCRSPSGSRRCGRPSTAACATRTRRSAWSARRSSAGTRPSAASGSTSSCCWPC